MKVLYITYDGILEPLGQSQVLGYIEELATNNKIYLLSYEKKQDLKDKESLNSLSKRLKNNNITWYRHRYHKTPSALSTLYDISIGVIKSSYIILRHKVDALHTRSYVPTMIAYIIEKIYDKRFIFDMRGFWVDERIDGGLWNNNSSIYKIARNLEKKFIKNSDHIVVLTYASKKELISNYEVHNTSISVIPTCADLDRFKPVEQDVIKNDLILGYVGSIGTWYLFDKVLYVFKKLQQINSNFRLLIINRSQHAQIEEELNKANINRSCVEVISCNHKDVHKYIRVMDAGIFFYKPSFSRIACSPTRFAEFIGCGVPCIINAGVGDLDQIILKEKVGIVLDSFEESGVDFALSNFIEIMNNPLTKEKCRLNAINRYSLLDGVKSYNKIYKSMESDNEKKS